MAPMGEGKGIHLVVDHLEAGFPGLKRTKHDVTSEASVEYNCIAWAAGDTGKAWWPSNYQPYPSRQYYWPRELPRICTLENFIAAFRLLGYSVCKSFKREIRFEKVAIYVNGLGKPTHMARQLETGKWTSKLGDE